MAVAIAFSNFANLLNLRLFWIRPLQVEKIPETAADISPYATSHFQQTLPVGGGRGTLGRWLYFSRQHCPQCENGQGGDIADDRLPKAEPWWADRGAEAEGKKGAVLDPSLWIVPFTLRCVAFFVHAFSWTLSNHFTRWVAGA